MSLTKAYDILQVERCSLVPDKLCPADKTWVANENAIQLIALAAKCEIMGHYFVLWLTQ